MNIMKKSLVWWATSTFIIGAILFATGLIIFASFYERTAQYYNPLVISGFILSLIGIILFLFRIKK